MLQKEQLLEGQTLFEIASQKIGNVLHLSLVVTHREAEEQKLNNDLLKEEGNVLVVHL